MAERRKFIKQLLGGAVLGSLGLPRWAFGQVGKAEPESRDALSSRLALAGSEEDFWAEVRKEFHFLNDQRYLNSATLGLMPNPVIKKMQAQVLNMAQGSYSLYNHGRKQAARLLGVDTDEISMTHNTTEGINIVANGLRLRKRDEIIITDHEHVGSAVPWLNRAQRDRLKLRVFTPGQTAAETLNRINNLITRRTRVIAVPHITCTTGTVLPIREIAQLARDKGIICFLDGAHGPITTRVNLREVGCDFYATCGHKWICGPPGTGMLYVRQESLDLLDPIMTGAFSAGNWELSREKQQLDGFVDSAHRFDYGTQSKMQRWGLRVAIEFWEEIGLDKVEARGRALADYLQQQLLATPGIRMLTPTEARSRAFIIGFKVGDVPLKAFQEHKDFMKYRIRLVSEAGLDSVRLSMHAFNNHADIDETVAHLKGFL